MQEQEELTPAQRELEAALGALRPGGAGVARDDLMFRAGRASARRGRWAWLAAGVLLAAGLGASLAIRPRVRVVERVVYVEAAPRLPGARAAPPAPEPAAPPAGPAIVADGSSYLRLRALVLHHGVEALPQGEPAPAAPARREQLQELLGLPLRRGAPPGLLGRGRRIQGGES